MRLTNQTRFHGLRLRFERRVASDRASGRVWEFFLFVLKQGWACLFGGVLLLMVLLTKELWPAHALLSRYDFLFLAALTLQVVLLALRLETPREAGVILVFHIVGTAMELFKTHVGSWAYPEASFFRIGQVPLFSGFMYASVGSYLARVSRIFDMRYTHYPSRGWTLLLAALIYANFFTHHYVADIRYPLFGLLAWLYRRTWVYFRVYQKFRSMPLLLGFCLVALFIWGAENIGTFATIWVYPHQRHGWRMVPLGKYGSWLLLTIISFVLTTLVHAPSEPVMEAMAAGESEPGLVLEPGR